MKKLVLAAIFVSVAARVVAGSDEGRRDAYAVKSPDAAIEFRVLTDGELGYTLSYGGRELVARSRLGFEFRDEKPMKGGFEVIGEPKAETGLVEAWKSVVRTRHADIRLAYSRLVLKLRERGGERRRMDLTVQVYNDGVAFRYTLFSRANPGERHITEELTELRVPETSYVWAAEQCALYGGSNNSQEGRFRKTKVTDLGEVSWYMPPLLVEVDRSAYLAYMSACLVDYPGFMTTWRDGAIVTRLVEPPGDSIWGVKASFAGRFDTPWRVILVGPNPGKLIESEIVRAVNPPCAIADTSWIKAGMSAWDHWWSGDAKIEMAAFKEYIDFAAKQGWPYAIVDWGWYGPYNRVDADITKSAPQIDIPELVRYAAERKVRLWLWVYCRDASRNDAYVEAFRQYEKWGIAGVKVDFMDRYDRGIVNWYRRLTAAAADCHLLVNFHGAFAPDGIDRTYPNQLTREGVLGGEYYKCSRAVTPGHNVTLAFTRLLAGPMDYTPGGFLNVSKEDFRPQVPTLVMNTRAAELSKFVIYESPWCCFCDHPRHVLGQPGAEFVAKVPVEWDDVRFLGGYPEEWVALARRNGDEWYVAVMGGDEAREVEVDVSSLGRGKMRYWADGDKPTELKRGEAKVPADGRLRVKLAPGGGYVAILF